MTSMTRLGTNSPCQELPTRVNDIYRRKWSNPEIIPFDVGLRLEHLADSQVDLIWALLKASLSDVGYAKVKASVRMNDFLGEICCAKANLNERSYLYAAV